MVAPNSDVKKAAPIYLAMLAPLAGVAVLAAILVSESYSNLRAVQTLDDILHLSTDASDLAHELQRERGMSAGFINSGGADFRNELKDQRTATNEQIARIGARVRLIAGHHKTEQARLRDDERAGRIGTALDALDAWRSDIDQAKVTVPELAGFYTKLIADLLSYPDDPLIDGTADEMARQNAIYQYTIAAKEYAGQERAAGTGGFSAGGFAVQRYARLNGLIQRQIYLTDRVRLLGTPNEISLLDAAINGAAAMRLNELRDIAAASIETGEVQGITAPEWFAASTAYLAELRNFESRMAEELISEADQLAADARFRLTAFAIAAAVLMLGAGFLGWRFVHSLITSLYGLRNAITRIERAEEGIDVPGQKRRDMVGEISRSLLSIRDKGADAKRVEAAIEGSTAALVIIGTDAVVRFENAAFKKILETHPKAFGIMMPQADDGTKSGAPLMKEISDAEKSGGSIAKSAGEQAVEFTFEKGIFEARVGKVHDVAGTLIGHAIQITDVTSIRSLENQVVSILKGLEQGQLSDRVDMIDDLGFTSVAARGINELMDSISEFMSELDSALSSMSQGDLTAHIRQEFKGDFEIAKTTFNENLETMASMVEQVIHSSVSVQNQADPIADSSRNLARRAQEQAAALEEVSATMEEMSTTISNSAENAAEAANLASTASDRAGNGRTVLEDTQTAMAKIEGNSSKIVDIVGTIDAIAFQTNLLALNAAVEAARAGEAGKGFVIVANEVRTLAGLAGDAANQIRELINVSAADVEAGVELMSKTETALEQITEAVETLSKTIGSITVSSSEQALGVKEINATIAQLDELTQRNATAADEGASGAETLLNNAKQLIETVSRFKSRRDDTSAAA